MIGTSDFLNESADGIDLSAAAVHDKMRTVRDSLAIGLDFIGTSDPFCNPDALFGDGGGSPLSDPSPSPPFDDPTMDCDEPSDFHAKLVARSDSSSSAGTTPGQFVLADLGALSDDSCQSFEELQLLGAPHHLAGLVSRPRHPPSHILPPAAYTLKRKHLVVTMPSGLHAKRACVVGAADDSDADEAAAAAVVPSGLVGGAVEDSDEDIAASSSDESDEEGPQLGSLVVLSPNSARAAAAARRPVGRPPKAAQPGAVPKRRGRPPGSGWQQRRAQQQRAAAMQQQGFTVEAIALAMGLTPAAINAILCMAPIPRPSRAASAAASSPRAETPRGSPRGGPRAAAASPPSLRGRDFPPAALHSYPPAPSPVRSASPQPLGSVVHVAPQVSPGSSPKGAGMYPTRQTRHTLQLQQQQLQQQQQTPRHGGSDGSASDPELEAAAAAAAAQERGHPPLEKLRRATSMQRVLELEREAEAGPQPRRRSLPPPVAGALRLRAAVADGAAAVAHRVAACINAELAEVPAECLNVLLDLCGAHVARREGALVLDAAALPPATLEAVALYLEGKTGRPVLAGPAPANGPVIASLADQPAALASPVLEGGRAAGPLVARSFESLPRLDRPAAAASLEA